MHSKSNSAISMVKISVNSTICNTLFFGESLMSYYSILYFKMTFLQYIYVHIYTFLHKQYMISEDNLGSLLALSDHYQVDFVKWGCEDPSRIVEGSGSRPKP